MNSKNIHSPHASNLFDAIPVGLFQLNTQLKITAINPIARKILGLEPKGKNKLIFTDIDLNYLAEDGTDLPLDMHPALKSLKTGGEQRDVVVGFVAPGVELKWVCMNTSLLYYSKNQKVKGVICSFTDITSAKKSEIKYRSIIDTAPDGIIIIDQQGSIQLINRQVEIIFGYSRNELLGNAVEKLLPGRFHGVHVYHRDRYSKNPHTRSMGEGKELYARKSNNEEIPVEISLSPIRTENEILIAASIRDITKRKKIEEKTVEIERKYQRAINALGDNVWEHDFVNGLTWFSESIIDLTGYTLNEIKDNAGFWWKRVHRDDLWILEKNNDLYTAGLINKHADEYRIYHKDGSIKWVLDRGKVYETDKNNKPLKIIGTHKDITDRKLLQRKLEQERENREREILKATVAGQEKEKNVIGMELHDNINQILVTVKMYLEIAKAEKDRREEMLTKSYNQLDKVIMEIRKLSHSLVSSALDDSSLHDVLKTTIEEISTGKKFNIQFTDNLNGRFTDKERELLLFRIVQEQLSNITKYARAENICISLEVQNDLIKLAVVDDGIGFDVKQTTRGIGLRNILNRVNIYSGKMNLTSFPGEGCTLEVEIPQ